MIPSEDKNSVGDQSGVIVLGGGSGSEVKALER